MILSLGLISCHPTYFYSQYILTIVWILNVNLHDLTPQKIWIYFTSFERSNNIQEMILFCLAKYQVKAKRTPNRSLNVLMLVKYIHSVKQYPFFPKRLVPQWVSVFSARFLIVFSMLLLPRINRLLDVY